MKFIINRETVDTKVHPATTLLDFLRRHLHLTGTKEGCREGDCGACSVLIGTLIGNKVDYKNVNSCLIPIADLEGKHIITIEGLNNHELSPFQKAMVDEGGTQCGFCTPGFILSMTGYLLSNKNYTTDDAYESIAGNICRCTGHNRIKNAVSETINFLENIPAGRGEQNIKYLTRLNIIPDYIKNISVQLKILNKDKKNNNTKGVIIGGGTDIFVQQWENLLKQKINVQKESQIKEKIKIKNGICSIKASATVSEIAKSKQLNKLIPGLKNYLGLFGSLPIRNRATLGGNIINASPIADTVNILLALNSKVVLKNGKGKRVLFLKDFYKGYKNLDRKKDEIIDEIIFPIPSKNTKFNFEKVSKRTYLDIASVNTSILIEVKNRKIVNVNLSAGGVAPIPLYLKNTSEFMKGKELSVNVIKESVSVLNNEIAPISDIRGSAEYKRLLLRQLIFAHFLKLFPEIIKPEELLYD